MFKFTCVWMWAHSGRVCVCFLLAVKCLRGGRACVRALLQICQWEEAAQGLVECVCVCVCVCVCWAWIVPPKGGRESGLSQPSLSAWSCRSYECMRPVFIWGAHGKSDCGHFESKKLGEARWTFSSEIKRRVGGERCVCVYTSACMSDWTQAECVCACLFNYIVILALSSFCLHSHSRTVKTSLFLGLHTYWVKQGHHWLFLCKNNYKLRVRDISLYKFFK